MQYGPKDLRAQLIEFAAKRLLSKVIDAAANGAAAQYNQRKYHHMFTAPTTRAQAAQQAQATANQPANGRQKYSKDDPVELWVNTVIVHEDGAKPVRLLSGRPLRIFDADKDVTTSNEEFNRSNAISNGFVQLLNEDAAKLNFGESKYYSPNGVRIVEEDEVVDGVVVTAKGELSLAKGIYFQLHREITDPAADAAAKSDINMTAKESLRKLFG